MLTNKEVFFWVKSLKNLWEKRWIYFYISFQNYRNSLVVIVYLSIMNQADFSLVQKLWTNYEHLFIYEPELMKRKTVTTSVILSIWKELEEENVSECNLIDSSQLEYVQNLWFLKLAKLCFHQFGFVFSLESSNFNEIQCKLLKLMLTKFLKSLLKKICK